VKLADEETVNMDRPYNIYTRRENKPKIKMHGKNRTPQRTSFGFNSQERNWTESRITAKKPFMS
jgi:hypothetical protein